MGDTVTRGCRPIAQRNTLRLLDPRGLPYPSTDVVPRSFNLDTESWRLRFTTWHEGEQGQRAQTHVGVLSWPLAPTPSLTDSGVCGAPGGAGPCTQPWDKHSVNETDQVSALGNAHRPGEVNNNQSNQTKALQRVAGAVKAEW